MLFLSAKGRETAFKRGDLDSDAVVVVRGQGPKANGMLELYGLMPSLSIPQDKGSCSPRDRRPYEWCQRKVRRLIHVSPEALAGGVIGKIQTR